MTKIYDDLYRFTDDDPSLRMPLHQYLLLTEEPVLIHTGTMKQAEKILPHIKELLNGRELKYILASHFGPDECGGLSLFQKMFPEVAAVCSEPEAWELYNRGYTEPIVPKKTGEILCGNDFEFSFVDYFPGKYKMGGLLFIENKRGILFCGDLMSQTAEQEDLISLKNELLKRDPAYIAVGQSPCPDLKK